MHKTVRTINLGAIRNRPYTLAVIVIGVATLARLALDPVLRQKPPLLLFACGIVVAALYGGLRAGIAVTILAIPVCDYLFVEPRYTWFLYDAPGDSVMLALFLLLGVAITAVVEKFHRTKEHLRQTVLELQQSETPAQNTCPDSAGGALHRHARGRLRLCQPEFLRLHRL